MEIVKPAYLITALGARFEPTMGAVVCSLGELTVLVLKQQTTEEFYAKPYWWVVDGTIYTNDSPGVWVKCPDMEWRKGVFTYDA